jgi:hypothetical protein
MRCEDISAKSVDYLARALGDAERLELESHLDSCPACRAELDDLSQIWTTLGELPAMAHKSAAMRARFEALLTDRSTSTSVPQMPATDGSPDGRISDSAVPPGREAPSPTNSQAAPSAARSARNSIAVWVQRHATLRPALQACAALLLLLIGIQLGRQTVPSSSSQVGELSQQVRELRQMVILSLMQQQSASERLKGVNWSNELDRPSNEVLAALIDALRHDPNVNVRMASIDALKRFADRETVRAATLEALSTQASPLVQMALIDFVVETRDRGAIDALRRLSRDRSVDPTVRARATWGIDHLEAA